MASPQQPKPQPKLRRLGLLVVAFGVALGGFVFADYWSARPPDTPRSFVGRDTCASCHQDQVDAFAGSHHDRAMDIATEQTVLGDFDDVTIQHDGITSRMYRDGEKFMIDTEGPDGEIAPFEIKYVFGVEPLQQYMVEFDRSPTVPVDAVSRLQVLRISWDTEAEEWFYLRPPDVDDKLSPDDPLHWTGIAQRWQTMCAECHSTNLVANFDPTTQQYHTTFSEIDVSCESCHGPASLHVELAQAKSLFWDRHHGYGLAKLKGSDPKPQLDACAPCHSRRSMLTDNFLAGDHFSDHFQLELLRDETYFADGQIKDEVYVYGSFIQSKMYHKDIRCTDCHDPHSLKLKWKGNQVCTSCHQHSAGKYDVPAHHHHQPGTPGAMCVNCHMPERTYMDVDPRRDHSLRIPRPDLSVSLGTPNACSGCHVADQLPKIDDELRVDLNEYADWQAAAAEIPQIAEAIARTDQWCDEACQQWYGSARQTPPHFAEAIAAFRNSQDDDEREEAISRMLTLATQPSDYANPAIARASAINDLAMAGVRQSVAVAMGILDDPRENAIVRAAAIGAVVNAPDPKRIMQTLLPLLRDDDRLVRTEAARGLVISGVYRTLSGAEQASVDRVLSEIKQSLMLTDDRAGAHMNWAMLCESRGRYDQAITAYQTAMKVEPNTTGPRTNLASLLERLAQQTSPEQQAAVQAQVKQLRADELPLLARDASLAPDNAMIQYRYGLALYLADELESAMERLERAVELEPEAADFRQARDLLREKLQE